jgi:hypothetical protein
LDPIQSMSFDGRAINSFTVRDLLVFFRLT